MRSVEVGCPNECLHFHGPWITAGLGSADLYKHGETDSQQIFQVTSLGSFKALLFLNANFTISRDFRGFHPSKDRHILPSVPCNAQGHSHLSMFHWDWQQHTPGDRVAFPVRLSVYTVLVAHNSGTNFPFGQSLWSLLLGTSQ